MKRVIAIILVVLVLGAAYAIVPGMFRCGSPYLGEYSLAEDGTSMTANIASSSSMGYIRRVKTHTDGDVLLLDCYNAFGGINGSLGAKDTFTFDVDEGITAIALYTGDGYRTVLTKDASGTWQRG